MKKYYFLPAFVAVGLLVPVAAQTVLKMPERQNPTQEQLAENRTTALRGGSASRGLLSAADTYAVDQYTKMKGATPEMRVFYSPDAPEDDTQYTYTGFNVAAGDNNGNPTGGLVNFNLEPFACDTVSSHSGVSPYSYVKGDELNCLLYTQDWTGKYQTLQRTVYDANTLEFKNIFTADVPHDGNMSYAPYILSYDDQRDVVYCITMENLYKEGVSCTDYYLNIFDEPTNTVKRIGLLGSWVNGAPDEEQYSVKAFCAGYGTLYVLLAKEEVYLAKINSSTLETTIIGKTTMPTKYLYGLQPMIYNANEGRFYVNNYTFDTGTTYYKISTWAQDGVINTDMIEQAPTGFTFFYRRPETQPSYYKYELKRVDDLKVTYNSDTEIEVDFTVPSLLADGSEIDYPSWVQDYQKTAKVYVYVDGVYANVQGFPNPIPMGEHLTGTVDLTISYPPMGAGLHTVTLSITPNYNEIATSRVSETLVVGDDAPGRVGNLLAVSDGKNVTITWDAPIDTKFADFGTELGNGDITYRVVRDNDGEVIAENIAATTYTDTIESDEFTGYNYTVYASINGHEGLGTTTSKVYCGSYLVLPYVNEFTGLDCLAGWTILNLDNNGTYRTWQWNQYYNLVQSSGGSGDDWLISPPVRMKKGEVYELRLRVDGYGTLNIAYGLGTDAESMTNRLATIEKAENEPFVYYFTPDADGEYNIGIHNYTANIIEAYWYVDDFGCSLAAIPSAPAQPVEARFVTDADGAYSGNIIATMPSKTVDGKDLSGLTAFVAYDINGNELGRVENVTPGAEAKIPFNAEHGWNYLKVAAHNEEGSGYPVVVKTYVGSDIAKPVANLRAKWGKEKNQAVISWDVPTEGVNGGWIDAENLSYKVYQYMPNEWPNRRELAEIFENEVELTILDNDKQDQYVFSVTALTAEGESEFANGSIVLGTPFTMPVAEPLGQEGMSVAPYIVTNMLGHGSWAVDGEYYNANVKSQNSDGVQLVYINEGSDASKGRFATPIIDFTNAKAPVMSVWAHHTIGMDAESYLIIEATTDGGKYQEISGPISLTGNNGYQQHVIDLSSLNGKKAQVGITAYLASPKDRVFVDNFAIREAAGNDLAITGITATRYEKSGETLKVNVSVANLGVETADDYIVMFTVNGVTVNEKEVRDALKPGCENTLTFELPLTSADNGVTTYYAELLYDGDSDESNNISETQTVTLLDLQLPAPSNLMANELDLTWNAPVIGNGREVVLDFEDMPAFTTDDIAGWTTYDGDGHLSISFVQYYNNYWPYTNQPLAWMVWGAKEAGCPDAAMWQPFGGDHCLIAWGNYGLDENDRDNSAEPEDDWFISPEVLGGSDFSFMTLANDLGCVFEVLTSSTDNKPESFTNKVSTVGFNATGEWNEVKCTLPNDAKYVALHVVANGFGILVDNIRYTDARTPQLKGYNVYCGPRMVTFAETTSAKGDSNGVYGVSALYNLGESDLSNTLQASGVNQVAASESALVATGQGILTVMGAEGENVAVVAADGRVYYSGVVNTDLALTLPAGVYVVKVADKSVKALVK